MNYPLYEKLYFILAALTLAIFPIFFFYVAKKRNPIFLMICYVISSTFFYFYLSNIDPFPRNFKSNIIYNMIYHFRVKRVAAEIKDGMTFKEVNSILPSLNGGISNQFNPNGPYPQMPGKVEFCEIPAVITVPFNSDSKVSGPVVIEKRGCSW